MKPQLNPTDRSPEYQNLLDLLERTEKYFEDIKIDRSRLKSYRHLLRFLATLPDETVREILHEETAKGQKVGKRLQPDLSELEIHSMPIERIVELASMQETPRRHLEQIAALRFGVTRGALSALRTRQALADKIGTLVNNEKAHESISRAALHQGSR